MMMMTYLSDYGLIQYPLLIISYHIIATTNIHVYIPINLSIYRSIDRSYLFYVFYLTRGTLFFSFL